MTHDVAHCDGWVYEKDGDGCVTVKDRCMVCNEPPWYRVQRRHRALQRFWPFIFVAAVYAIPTLVISMIALYEWLIH